MVDISLQMWPPKHLRWKWHVSSGNCLQVTLYSNDKWNYIRKYCTDGCWIGQDLIWHLIVYFDIFPSIFHLEKGCSIRRYCTHLYCTQIFLHVLLRTELFPYSNVIERSHPTFDDFRNQLTSTSTFYCIWRSASQASDVIKVVNKK